MAVRKGLLAPKSKKLKNKRDFLDSYESYRYMDTATFFAPDLFNYSDGRWEYSKGWLEKNIYLQEWDFLEDFRNRVYSHNPISSI
ncbi:MAG: hypothetical protein L6Q54_12235 [Leptospiraceae bacterium]|nr:hypothetical protein [Leptospiraceae bacterium]MCK6382000.1 hypothetical protein [Leptospiraceae bacterium]NUM40371.1 hypothetical protein [Leptospiraceae bacterium]